MQKSVIHYLAYGSNLHPLRLKERIPSARFVAVTQLHNRKLVFHKKSNDGSGKCDLVQIDNDTGIAHGAIYQLKPEDKAALDQIEGKGKGYDDRRITLQHDGRAIHCFVYMAQQSHILSNLHPYHWYKKLVILGAEFQNFPDAYISAIRKIHSSEDKNPDRRQENEQLIKRIHGYQ